MKKDKQTDKQQPFSFTVRNLGSIHTGKFTQKPLTIFCGPNNSGKTWAMYALHSFYAVAKAAAAYRLRNLQRLERDKPNDQNKQKIMEEIERKVGLKHFNNRLNANISDYFNIPNKVLQDTKFKCNRSPQQWQEWIENYPDPYVFLMPAERNGLHLFYRELSSKRTALLHHASKENIDLGALLKDVMRSRYAQPIADYIDWLNSLTELRKTADNFHDEALWLQKNLARGRYQVNRRTGDISYKPYQKKRGVAVNDLGLHAASSTVKSLFGLWFYLEHQAKAGDILMIDEPELNIHPRNQLLIARLLARLVHAGIQVVISTHSDYIVREFNNLVMLSEDPSGAIRKRYKYLPEEVLNESQVAAYVFDNNTIEPYNYKLGQGFSYSTFDTEIFHQNEVSTNIYHDLEDLMEGKDDE